MEKGFSTESSQRIMAPQASSTQKVFSSKWKIFEFWCLSKDLDPFKATIPQIADFLLYLFHEKKLAFKSIEGYRTAISRPIKLATGLDVGQDPLLLNLLKSFLRERPGALQPFPAWDLSFVLFSLVKHPFEPISEIPLQLLTWKTVFLTLLASGARRGELHAIAYSSLTQAPNWINIVLRPIPGFISKTELRTK